jgi:hypothetical protein
MLGNKLNLLNFWLVFQIFVSIGSHCAYGQTNNYFIEYASTQTYGQVRNSLHYNDDNTRFRGGFSVGLGWTTKMKKKENWYWLWNYMYNQRKFELNRLQPYSGSSLATTLYRDTRGLELLWGVLRKMEVSPIATVLVAGGLTQNVVGKQYQYLTDQFGNTTKTQTFGVGSATFRNRAFLRAGVELKLVPKIGVVIESSFSAEIKAAFVKTVDKVNPISFGLHLRLVKFR